MDPSAFPRESSRRGLASSAGLAEVEAAMHRLAQGDRPDVAGAIAAEALESGGKRLRARLALAAGEALGLERERVVPWAAACELLHQATLVHDDIQDGDRERRGRATAWAKHGVGQAINAGDLMLMLPLVAVGTVEASPGARARLYGAVAEAACHTARGQALEMDLPTRDAVTWEDWVWAAEGKSGALLALPVEGAAILAGRSDRTARALARAFRRAGVLYQLQDDLLDLSLAKGKGRRAADLEEGKVNALVAAHLRLHPREAGETLRLLRTPELRGRPGAVSALIDRLFTGGAVAFVHAQLEASAAEFREEPRLRAVPGLAALADELIHQVQAAARTIRFTSEDHAA